MSKNNVGAISGLIFFLAVIAIGIALSGSNDSDNSSYTQYTPASDTASTNKSSYSSNGGYSSGGSGNRSSYWYDDETTRKKKADNTLKKYYDVDDEGHILGPKEGTIRNGKPYHATK